MRTSSRVLLSLISAIADRANERARREAAYQRMRSLFESAPEGIFIADVDGRFMDVNAAGARMFGYSIRELLGMRIADLIQPEDAARLERQRGLLLAGAEIVNEWYMVRKDGRIFPIEASARILPDGRWQAFVRDITARKHLEAEVHQAQERFELALSGADLAAWDWNVETGEVLFSPRWAEMLGYSADEITPRVESWSVGIHPEDLPRVEQVLKDHFDGRAAEYECEFRVQTKSGAWIWILDRGKVFARNAQGVPTRMLGTVLDITTRKRADTELRLAHETTSGILSMSTDAIISVDEHYRITMFNEGAEAIFGYSKAEAIGAPLDLLLPERFRVPHRQHVEGFSAGDVRSKSMAQRSVEIFGVRKNGEEFPAEAAISKLEVGGHRVLTVTMRDVTEQRRHEHEQRFLAEVGPILASSLDYEMTLDQVAQLAVRELADLCIVDIFSVEGTVRRLKAACRAPELAWVGDTLTGISLDQSLPYLAKSALENREPLLIERLSPETLATYAQSEVHLKLLRCLEPASLIAVPLLAHGNLLGAIALMASGSSRRFGPADLQLAQELARRAALAIESARLYGVARRASQARDDVLGIVAHDLRNPLNAISLHAHMLRAQDGRDRKVGESLQRSVTRMNRLIQDILDVTRIEAGQLAVERQRVSTVQALLDVIETQRPLAESRKLALLLEVAPDVPDVWGDRDRLLQICENLIGNAIKFTTHGNVTVGARAREDDVLVWVKDTGAGVTPEVLPHVFDRFWKSDRDTHRGAGLGLAIVKGLVEAHGGRVWAESTPGNGTCFYFTIPKAPSTAPRESAEQRSL